MKYGNYNLRKGTKVKVFSGLSKRYLGIWEYDKAIKVGPGYFTPRFKQGKKKIHGYSCWWIPLSIAKKAEEKVKEKGVIFKDEPTYTKYSESKKNCTFKINGKLKSGRIVGEWNMEGWYLVGYYDPKYKEEALDKNKVKILTTEEEEK